MSEEYPLYPHLSEKAAEEAQQLIDSFKDSMRKAAQEVLSTLYCDVVFYIESDSWSNFRNQLMDGLRNYGNSKIQSEFDFKEIRQQILKEFRSDIITDLNQDNVEEIKKLKSQIEKLQKLSYERSRI